MAKYQHLWQEITKTVDSAINLPNNRYNYYYLYLIKRDKNYRIYENEHLLINYVYNQILKSNFEELSKLSVINTLGLLFGGINVVKDRNQYCLITHASHYKSYYEITHSSELYPNGDKSLNDFDKAVKLILSPKSKLVKISKCTGISYHVIQQYRTNLELLGHASWLNVNLLSQLYDQHTFEDFIAR